MPIKYVTIPEHKKTIAILEDTRFDAVNHIINRCGDSHVFVCMNEYEMPNYFKSSVTCKEPDVFDPEIGRRLAKAKVLNKYYKAYDKRVEKFEHEVEDFNEKIQKSKRKTY